MADFISREKEFRAINEQIDNDLKRSTINSVKKFSERSSGGGSRQTQMNSKGTDSNTSDRFATYTKSKANGGSNWMKKSGGGDYLSPPKSPPISPISKANRKENYSVAGNSGSDAYETPKQRKSNASEDIFPRTTTKINTHHQMIKSVRQFNPIHPSNEPIKVKYQNKKFSASPSLDNMIKESLEKLDDSERKEEFMNFHPCNDGNNNWTRRRTSSPTCKESHSIDGKNTKKFLNSNNLIRFLKSKIALLEDNQAKSYQDLTEQKEAFEDLNERLKVTKQQRDKTLSKNTALVEQIEKLTSQLHEANQRCKERSQEFTDKHQELECLKREFKQLKLAHKSLETRYTRAHEELETALKSQECLKNNERELIEKLRRHADAKDNEIKCLKKQRSDLFTAYKKQLYLIDNLRQQNICMEQAKMIDFSEKEFSKVLEWNL